MKLFRLLSTTAATVLAIAALAVSASAMSATYDAATGNVTISDITYNASAEQKTLLILNEDTTTVAEGHIVQIDQAADFTTVTVGNLTADIDKANNDALAAYATELAAYNTALEAYNADQTEAGYTAISAEYDEVQAAKAALDSSWKASQTYYVRVGGNGVVDETTGVAFDACHLVADTTVENNAVAPVEPTAPTPDEPTYMLGDVNNDSNINLVDASAILDHFMEIKTITDENAKAAADVNSDTNINLVDFSAVVDHFMEIKAIQ